MDVMSYVMGTSQINPNVLKPILDGEIKKKGGAKIEELRFELDAEIVTENSNKYIKFTNMEQIKKVLDRNMDIYIIYHSTGCGEFTNYYDAFFRCGDTIKFDGLNGSIKRITSANAYVDTIKVVFEDEAHLSPVSAKLSISTSFLSIVSIYATI